MNKLLNLAKTKIGCGYVWGSQGEVVTSSVLQQLKIRFGSKYYDFNDGQGMISASKWINKQCFDCSGLIVWCLQQLGCISASQDYTAAMLYSKLCTPISKDKLKVGDLAFIRASSSSITHVGIYAGDNQVVEAKGTRYGVVINAMQQGFNVFGRLKFDLEDKTPVMDFSMSIDFISKLECVDEAGKIIGTPGYWIDNASKSTFNSDYVKTVFIRMAKYIQKYVK